MNRANLFLKKDMESTEVSWDRVWSRYDRERYKYQLAVEENRVRWQKISCIILDRYGSFEGLNCMEIGAGSGHYSMLFARRGARVTLLDYSEQALSFSKAVFSDQGIAEDHLRFIHMDALNIDEDYFDKFDISMSFGVAEHFQGKDRANIVKAHYDVLKQDGVTFISVPNAHCIPFRIYQCIARFKQRNIIECHAYSKGEFRNIAEENNFNSYDFIGSSYFDAYNPLAFYRRKKGIIGNISEIKKEKIGKLDKYLGREITFIGIKTMRLRRNRYCMGNSLSSIAVENKVEPIQAGEKIRVLIIGPASPSTGGIPSYIDELLASGLGNKYEFTLLDPLTVKKRSKKQESHFSLKEIIASLRVIMTFVKNVRAHNPSLVHIHTSSYWGFYEKAALMLITKYLFQRKTLLHIHGGKFDQFYKKAICRNLILWLLRQADKTLIVSKGIKKTLHLHDAVYVDNCTCFDTALFSGNKNDLRKKYGVPNGKTVFLSAALFQKEKGLCETLEAFAEITKSRKDFYFIIAGEGPGKNNIINLMELNQLCKNVRVMDYITGQEKEDIFLLSDVFILNSTVESFGISLIEAVSHGLFVITTPVGVASEAENIFNDGNCIRINIGDVKGLEKAIVAVLDKKINTAEISKQNFYDFKARFNVDAVFEKMKLIYEDVLSSN